MKMKIKKFEELSKIVPVLKYQRSADENTVVVSVDKLSFALKCLKLHFGYQYHMLSCISGVDFLGKDYLSSLGLPPINIPGCAPVGDNLTETIASILMFLVGLFSAHCRPITSKLFRNRFICNRALIQNYIWSP